MWQVEGDELGTGLFFAERRRPKRPEQQARLEASVNELSSSWRLHRYPWAGALSTAHTMLWYLRLGKDVFRRLGPTPDAAIPKARARVGAAKFDLARIAVVSAEREAAIWERLVHEDRRVTSVAYRELAAALPHARPSPGRWRVAAGSDPEPADQPAAGKPRREARGRRPSHAVNATKP